MKKYSLYGKTVIVTGASSGFGKLLSQKLVKNFNCKVIGIARTRSKLEELKAELGDNFTFFPFDCSVEQNWVDFARELDRLGVVPDVLINNAGVLPPFCTSEKGGAAAEDIMKVNFFSAVFSIRHVLPAVKRSDCPAVINVASSSALCPVIGAAAYCASKSALKAFTEVLSLENKQVYFSLICPGFAKTDIFRSQKQIGQRESNLILKVCSDPDKITDKMIKKISRRKKRVVLGLDAKAMDFFGRLMPRSIGKIIAFVLKMAKLQLFSDVFAD